MSDDEFVCCPYNSQHRVLRFRLPAHIVKCQLKYSGPPLEICSYNATHRVPPAQMVTHMLDCKDRLQFHRASYLKEAINFKSATENNSIRADSDDDST